MDTFQNVKIRDVHLIGQPGPSNGENKGLEISFENYSPQHTKYLLASFKKGEIGAAMETIEEAVEEEFHIPDIRITAKLIQEKMNIKKGKCLNYHL